MKLVVVIQARTGSSRLPGKVLAPVCGKPLLAHMLDRVRLAREPDTLVVATSYEPADDPIEALCDRLEVPVFRGHPLDCLDRHLHAGRAYDADAVVKIPSDCPLIDAAIIDRILAEYRLRADDLDYLSNLQPATWPDGNDVEVIAFGALATAAREARDPFDREHTTPFITARPERFRSTNVTLESGLDLSKRFRWVVDWPEDLTLVRHIFEALAPQHGPKFGLSEIFELFRRRPELGAINASRRGYHYSQARAQPVAIRPDTLDNPG